MCAEVLVCAACMCTVKVAICGGEWRRYMYVRGGYRGAGGSNDRGRVSRIALGRSAIYS